ncbi:hypothetical protein [Klebsiella pneumoniae IS43]|uniref:Uncharacterized protein n=1 Tax=Klebsiella pneumoniae IS43 TaxID=1432552 RepID=W1DU69_KLEPN|nr:hypothetical protein [Klebsiella pneumoniae IS43]
MFKVFCKYSPAGITPSSDADIAEKFYKTFHDDILNRCN